MNLQHPPHRDRAPVMRPTVPPSGCWTHRLVVRMVQAQEQVFVLGTEEGAIHRCSMATARRCTATRSADYARPRCCSPSLPISCLQANVQS